MKRGKPGVELEPVDIVAEAIEPARDFTLNPVSALRRLRERGKETKEARVRELAGEVVKKLTGDITEHGMVSVFRNQQTGEVVTEMFSAEFSSPRFMNLGVTLGRHSRPTLMRGNQLYLSMIEHTWPHRQDYWHFSVERDFDMPEGEFSLRFSKGGTDEGDRLRIPYGDKVSFLEDVLATEVDIAQTEKKFGASYTPGATREGSFEPMDYDKNVIYTGYWVRDVIDQLAPLGDMQAAPELPV